MRRNVGSVGNDDPCDGVASVNGPAVCRGAGLSDVSKER